jgi:hypothetical protein
MAQSMPIPSFRYYIANLMACHPLYGNTARLLLNYEYLILDFQDRFALSRILPLLSLKWRYAVEDHDPCIMFSCQIRSKAKCVRREHPESIVRWNGRPSRSWPLCASTSASRLLVWHAGKGVRIDGSDRHQSENSDFQSLPVGQIRLVFYKNTVVLVLQRRKRCYHMDKGYRPAAAIRGRSSIVSREQDTTFSCSHRLASVAYIMHRTPSIRGKIKIQGGERT